jgi:hypothetical protein
MCNRVVLRLFLSIRTLEPEAKSKIVFKGVAMFYEAIFEPSKEFDYSKEAKKLAGKKVAVCDGGILNDGPLKGKNCFYVPSSTVGFIPINDLRDLKPISQVRWQEIRNTLDV